MIKISTSLLFFLAYLSGYSQSNNGWFSKTASPLFELQLNAAVPHGDFAHNTHSVGFGGSLDYYYPFSKNLPLYIGFSGGGALMGSHSQHLHRDIEISVGNTIIDVIPIDLDVRTNNAIWNGFVKLRAVAPFPLIKVYFDGLIGLNYLNTSTTIYDRTQYGWLSVDGTDVVNSSTQLGSWAFAYGGEAGFIIPTSDIGAFKFGLSYIIGGDAEYYDETQINEWDVQFSGEGTYNPNDLNNDDFEINQNAIPRLSATNMFLISFGFSKYLGL